MDKLTWFKFTPSDWMMGKIQRCPEITQARFMRLCCLYWNKECNLSVQDAIIEIDEEHYNILISKKIIKSNEDNIFIDFLDELISEITEISKGKSKAAKVRWEKYRESKTVKKDMHVHTDAMHVHTDAMQNDASAMQNDAEKRREDKRREENIKKEKYKKEKGVPPPFTDFIIHCREKAKEMNIIIDEKLIKTKFDAWLENGWMDMNGKKIINWRSKITSNITYWQNRQTPNTTPKPNTYTPIKLIE
jgi:hypothetical protein